MANEDAVDEITDTLVAGVENSELAEVVVVIAACAYLGASRAGLFVSTTELDLMAVAVVGAAVGLDSLWKRIKRR